MHYKQFMNNSFILQYRLIMPIEHDFKNIVRIQLIFLFLGLYHIPMYVLMIFSCSVITQQSGVLRDEKNLAHNQTFCYL